MNQIMLYGLADASEQYKVVRYLTIDGGDRNYRKITDTGFVLEIEISEY